MASPLHSDEEIIKTVRGFGGAMAAAAYYLGISPRTLKRRVDKLEPDALEPEPDPEQLKNQQIEYKVLEQALKGNVSFMIFYLKHIGWGRKPIEPSLWIDTA